MDYIILILLILVVLFLISFGLIISVACPTDEEIEMRKEIDNPYKD